MKCKLVITLVTASIITSVLAQSAGDTPAKADPPPPKPALDAKSKAVVDQLTRTLSLTTQQQAKLIEMVRAQREKTVENRKLTQELFKAAGAKDAKRVKELQKQLAQGAGALKSSQDALDDQLTPILTPEQAERLKKLRNPTSSAPRPSSRRQRIGQNTLRQLRVDLKLNAEQNKQFDVIASSQSSEDTFTRVDAILNGEQKKILSKFRERYDAAQVRAAEIRNLRRTAEKLDLDTEQRRKVKAIKKSARKKLSLLRSGSDAVPADYAETLQKEIIAFLKPAQVEMFKKGVARGRPAKRQTRNAGKAPAKKP